MSDEVPFTYELPESVIAQRPVHPYHSAKLLVAHRDSGEIEDSTFFNITDYLKPGDLLLLNNSKVLAARMIGKLDSGGSSELLYLEKYDAVTFRCLAKPMRKLTPGRKIVFDEGLSAVVLERVAEYEVKVRFESEGDTAALVEKVGIMPIPPYIRSGISDNQDRIDYQTCFAKYDGSIAAPTAGLHFTRELLDKIEAFGVTVDFVTLHVGTASFLPIETEDGRLREPGEEHYVFSKKIIDEIVACRAAGGRVVAIGTTTIRALESMAAILKDHTAEELDGKPLSTSIFITPGYKFNFVDVMGTNFHQPRTTHLLLVGAFMGKELLAKSYEHALANNYRFLSYGDGMLVL